MRTTAQIIIGTILFSALAYLVNAQCGEGFSVCNDIRNGNTCYSAASHQCFTNPEAGFQVLCPVGYKACGSECYMESQHSCWHMLCGASELACNGKCYNPESFSCQNGLLCGVEEQRCGTACFDPSTHNCVNDEVVPLE